ncbi:hypothetical protein SEA_MARSHAWN_63 [Mycobacterium phage Marshawn]|uniref:Uncharacterized protein n=1 Tax=Mycobacterium phage Marshawn TaxID=2652423 RepID=A0A5P8D921_9CAUD|nr:hypothetical protein I5H02_gp36 [Mycobacterium phage Marshawn]QFP94849.1 hypothetical protein SEA_MARSHAWN_63 [Mycobacterium phage Marshawn]
MSARSTFRARYRGRCGGCPEPVQPGDEVAFLSDGAVIHVDCEDTSHDDDKTRRHPVCGACWLEHPKGECP